jgi:PAS domain S-box-containing protein
MDTQHKTELIQEINTLRGEPKSYQSREAEWERAKQECQQIYYTAHKQVEEELRHLQEETAHAYRLLLALNQAAHAVQHARTTEDVYSAIQSQITQLGYITTGFELTEDGHSLYIAHVSNRTDLIRKAEKATGLSLHEFRFRPKAGSIYQRVLADGETVFVRDIAQAVAEVLPGKLRSLGQSIAELVKLNQTIFAPLMVGAEPIGVLSVSGPDLSEADNPSITAFANQAAIAIQNARMYELAQREITECKQVEEALRETEGKYRALFEGCSQGILATDIETKRFVDANPSLCRMFGYSMEELLRLGTMEIHPQEAQDEIKSGMEHQRQKGRSQSAEVPCLRKDGSIFYADISGATTVIHGRECLVGFFVDVTERKRAEEQLRYQATLLANVSDAIVASDSQYRLTAWNPAAEALYGWKAEEVLGRNGLEIIRTEWPEVEAEVMRRTIAKTKMWRGEATQARRDGTRFPVEVSSIVLHDESGQITGYVSVNHDITERKRAAEEIQSLARFPAENPNPILRIARDATLLYLNEAASSQLSEWHLQIYQAAPPMLMDPVFQSLNSETVQTIELEHGERTYAFTLTPIAAGYTNLYGRDITERKRADNALMQTNKQLRALTSYWQSAIEAERTSIAREIHDEFGQSLTAIKMDLNWLANHLPEGNESLERIHGMGALVDNSIALIRRIATDLRPNLLDDLGLNAALDWQAREFSRRSGIPCKLILTKDDLTLDPVLNTTLFRIFQETLTNVSRHAQATYVNASLQKKGKALILTIHDNGVGIQESELNNSRSLGLLSLRERALQWGGETSIRSAVGKGTTVTTRIPLPASPVNGGGQ